MPSRRFERFAAFAAVLALVTGLAYSITFVALEEEPGVPATFLLLGGLLALPVLVALYGRLRDVDPSFALLALLLGAIGAAGSIAHGGFDLANAVNVPADPGPDLPNEVDPRGLLTFAAVGLAFALFGWLMTQAGPSFPRPLGYVGVALGVVLVVLYVARLVVLDSDDPVVAVPAVVAGFALLPLWYGWLALLFWRADRDRRRSA